MDTHRSLFLALLVVGAFAIATTTGAFATSDEAVRGVYLDSADTANGAQYAEIGPDGQLRVEISNLSPDSRTVVDDVFVLGTDLAEASVWIEDDRSAVDFYRMDTGASVEDETDPVTLTDGESVRVGFAVESGAPGVVMESITLRAEIPDETSEGGTGGGGTGGGGTGGSGTGGGDTGGPPVSTATPTDTSTPTETTGSNATDTATPTESTGDGTATPGTATPTPTRTEVGGGGQPTDASTAGIEVVGLTTDPESPTVGETITVTATAENHGTDTATTTVEIRGGGGVIASETVTLEPGERTTVSGTVSFDEPGSYEIQGHNESVTVTVGEQSQSPLEIGGFAPVLLGGLVVLAAGLLAFVLWRSDEHDFVVALADESPATLELLGGESASVGETEGGRTILGYDVADDETVTLDPAFTVRNAGSSPASVRIVAVDEEGAPVTDGVAVQSTDGVDVTDFPDDDTSSHAIAAGGSLAVRLVLEADAVEAIATLHVETDDER
ncbi:CARDB domain-containing protein [Halomicrobium katesii]|uniref:CARDB domain-containing protein n=1 Tax=Halomicrobium katesii TaxID=437163 RepID=UPI00037C3842|nr:CARDB domain-containing protein [Halomicrobium katesii]